MRKIIVGIALVAVILSGCVRNVKDGVLLLEEGKYEEAISAFEEEIQNERNLEEAYRGVGIGHFELGQYEEAIVAFEEALKYEAEETAILCSLLGACHMQVEDYEQALDYYLAGLKKDDLTEELKQEMEFNLIAAYEYTGDWEAAKKQMEQYVEAYPEDTRVEKEAEFLETR